MTWLLLPLASLVLLVFGIMEVRRAPRESVPLPRNPRLARGLVYAFVAALPLVPFSPGWLVLFEGAVGLPVEPPESPVRAEPWSFDFDLGAGFLATVVLMLLLVYVAPPLVGFLVGRRRDLAARPLPSGRRLFLVAGMVAAAVAVVATARFAIAVRRRRISARTGAHARRARRGGAPTRSCRVPWPAARRCGRWPRATRLSRTSSGTRATTAAGRWPACRAGASCRGSRRGWRVGPC